MKFYVVAGSGHPPAHAQLPCVTLISDNWNDFGYRTLFHAHFVSERQKFTEIGSVKIGTRKGLAKTKLDDEFESLSDEYFSLGQSLDYYKNIKALKKAHREALLHALKDLVFLPELLPQAESTEVFDHSLMRYSSTRMVMRDARQLFTAEPPSNKTSCSFLFEIQLPGATAPHSLNVELGDQPHLPDRMMALIGKNGTGKTLLLGRLAAALSGDEVSVGHFKPEHPAFQRVIAVSYSAFDQFNKPTTKRTFSYVYCGIYDDRGKLLTPRRLLRKIRTAATSILEQRRIPQWTSMIAAALGEKTTDAIRENLFQTDEGKKLPRLSSGQLVLVSTITELVAAIQPESIVLMDEPELHQHPNSIAGLLFSFNELLQTFKSFALIATHSPLVIQQIPGRYVRLFVRVDNTTIIRDLGRESFGENLTTLTQEVFQTNTSPSLYFEWFKKITADLGDEEVMQLFPYGLSFNALSVMESVKQ